LFILVHTFGVKDLRDFESSGVFIFLHEKRRLTMGKKIYVGNISFKATEEDIRELFSRSGEVESVKMITDPHTGNAKGFGFVEMASDDDASKAIAELNGTEFLDRTITVAEARPQQPREGRGFGGGGRGGFGGGRGQGRGRR
jgi:RNA recognition motif-containing protein